MKKAKDSLPQKFEAFVPFEAKEIQKKKYQHKKNDKKPRDFENPRVICIKSRYWCCIGIAKQSTTSQY